MRHNWMKIIEVLNTDSQSIHSLGLTDRYFAGIFMKNINLFSKITYFSRPQALLYIFVMIVFTAKHLSLIDFDNRDNSIKYIFMDLHKMYVW